ncbi:hypothetical protein GEV33_004196 [Tenebrio molitor]|uniref:Uncharacterized protein n=1 Tax=Tenebrio molitor TaxID=7067 RepID=A0A8J6HPW3_TENMO|nr:hypothetical protein GEV33_004196 [Tenebrio molitor]
MLELENVDTRPVPPPEVQGGRPRSESSEEEAAPQKEESILPLTPELPREVVQAPTYSPQPSTSAEPQLWLPEVPLWRNGIIKTALSRKMPEKAIPEESVAVIQLLRDALNELINNNNEVPQNRVDEVYENVISSLNVPNDENPRRNGRRKGKQGGRRTRRRYVNGSMPEQSHAVTAATNASKRFADAAAFKKPAASTPRPATPSKHPPIGKVTSDHGPNRFDSDIEQQKLQNLQQKLQNLQEKLSDVHLNCQEKKRNQKPPNHRRPR